MGQVATVQCEAVRRVTLHTTCSWYEPCHNHGVSWDVHVRNPSPASQTYRQLILGLGTVGRSTLDHPVGIEIVLWKQGGAAAGERQYR